MRKTEVLDGLPWIFLFSKRVMARSSPTPDQLLRTFDEAPSSTVLVSGNMSQDFWPNINTLLYVAACKLYSISFFRSPWIFFLDNKRSIKCSSAGVCTVFALLKWYMFDLTIWHAIQKLTGSSLNIFFISFCGFLLDAWHVFIYSTKLN